MKNKEKSLVKSFRWTSKIKPENLTASLPNVWSSYAGNFIANDLLIDHKEIAYNNAGKGKEYKLLKNLRQSTPGNPNRYGYITGIIGV